MKNSGQERLKAHYQHLRTLSCAQLWDLEVPKFEAATEKDRLDQVSIVRAVGVVFAEAGNPKQKEEAKQWLRRLLTDSQEKIRRYAMAALPKLGSGTTEENDLLDLLAKTESERESKALAKTLEKIGGEATLSAHKSGTSPALAGTLQKLEANVARLQQPSKLAFDNPLQLTDGVQINLRCRSGLERILTEEIHEKLIENKTFRVLRSIPEVVSIVSQRAFTLGDLYKVRTFSCASIVLGTVQCQKDEISLSAFAEIIGSSLSETILRTLTDGPIRYRLELHGKSFASNFSRKLADSVYAIAPTLLNDPRDAPWEINVYPIPRGYSLELTPKLRPDPRFAYRQGDVPAASHPPLSACLARLAGITPQDTVWDPFCGSGLELIEKGLLGEVAHLFGTDLESRAIATAKANIAAAFPTRIPTTLVCCDFREYKKIHSLKNISLVISNPPLGKRVPVKDLDKLIQDLFEASAAVLTLGGRLVFVNPLAVSPLDRSLKLISRQKVDLGCFHCYVEKYQKVSLR